MVLIYLTFGAAVVALGLCVKNLIDNIRMYNEFKVFNENIKNWSQELDDNMMFALNQAAMKLLRDMDAHIDELNNNNNNLEEDEENCSRED